MKTIVSLSLLFVAGTTGFAGTPKKRPLDDYKHLSSYSPFTAKPTDPGTPPARSAFEDWALGGVSEIEGGYMVTLVHKKNAGETQIIKPSGTVHDRKDDMKWIHPGDPEGFKVERVDFAKEAWKETTVQLSFGSERATLGFDDKQLTPAGAAAPVQKVPPAQPGLQPQIESHRRVISPSKPAEPGQGQSRNPQHPR